jgi:glycosyltransferase involved in cell wall biosynthesis
MASIIIPAHNEEAVIESTLTTMLEHLESDDIEILVVCNGCEDDTAAIARGVDGRIRVVEIDRASKTEALNVGDSVLRSFPRIYLDADIAIDGRSIQRLIDYLQQSGSLATEPILQMDVSRSTFPVRAYYATWVALHGQRPGDVGGGIYAMSLEGRSRFEEFPDVIADDAYAKAHFNTDELVRVDDATSVVFAPERVAGLLQIKTRSRLGGIELQQKYPELWSQKRSHTKSLLGKATALPWRVWPAVPIYVALQLLARWRANRLASDLSAYEWQRDDSSRDHRR